MLVDWYEIFSLKCNFILIWRPFYTSKMASWEDSEQGGRQDSPLHPQHSVCTGTIWTWVTGLLLALHDCASQLSHKAQLQSSFLPLLPIGHSCHILAQHFSPSSLRLLRDATKLLFWEQEGWWGCARRTKSENQQEEQKNPILAVLPKKFMPAKCKVDMA